MDIVIAILLLASAMAAPEAPQPSAHAPDTFIITQTNPVISTSTISGKEGYSIADAPDGHTVKSHLWVAEGETPVLSQVEEQLGPDWTLKRYTFDAMVGGIKQKVEAWVDGGKVHMQVTGERMNPQRTVNFVHNAVILDNFVPTNFQVLISQFSAASAKTPALDSEDVLLLVPQRLLALKGSLSRSGIDTGVLNGKQISVNKFLLQAPGVKAEIWTNERDRLLGVYFSQPDIEYLQDGFDLPQLKSATLRRLPSERPVSFVSHGRRLLGTLMLPPESLGKRERYPVVVMVPGFGPLDRDETVGRSKPLRDLAVGLANRGIASLRYDKPTYSFHGKLNLRDLTVDEETIDAAAAAAAFAQTLPDIDTGHVFLLGHSEGGELAPFILEKVPGIRGVILMAVPGRPPQEFLPDQLAAGLKMEGASEDKIQMRVSRCREQLDAVRRGRDTSGNVLNMPPQFWRSLMAHDNITALKKVNVPVLVLQGERDGYLTRKDFDLVTAAVPSNRLERDYFNGLDHIFAPAPEGANGSEMLIGAHVAPQVIDRIASWLDKHGAAAAVNVASRAE